ncbi:hypothetical protein ABG768_003759 [Culter alburnus]|uniref:Uncharacterized protein n=1 Tax=Culter alburnus TaxID=194366 RepID=A0AAW1ZYV0_CULAL
MEGTTIQLLRNNFKFFFSFQLAGPQTLLSLRVHGHTGSVDDGFVRIAACFLNSYARSQVQGSLISSAGNGSLVPIAVATESESMSTESLPKQAQLNYQALGQLSNESVTSSSQQLIQTSFQSSGQLVQVCYQPPVQPIVKPQKSRLQTSCSTFVVKPLQQRNKSSRPSYQLGQGSYGSGLVSLLSGQQLLQSSIDSTVQPSSVKLAQARYQPVALLSLQQSSQASSQNLEQSLSQPGGLLSAQASSQSVSQQLGFHVFSMPEQSSYGSHSSLGSQPLEQPSNVPLSSSYEYMMHSFKPGF